jgi:hypothetical protein
MLCPYSQRRKNNPPFTWVRVMVFNATFKNISVISWQSVLFVEVTRVLGENHWPDASHWQTTRRKPPTWRKSLANYPKKTTDLTQVTDKLPGENHRPDASHWQTTRRKPLTWRKSLTNFIMKCCVENTLLWAGCEVTTSVVIGTDCISSCKSNYHKITTMSAPYLSNVFWENDLYIYLRGFLLS